MRKKTHCGKNTTKGRTKSNRMKGRGRIKGAK
jgi:hypothetical protein